MARPKGSKKKVEEQDLDEAPAVEFNEVDFRRDIEEVVRQKSNAQEYTGNVGQAVKQCADRSGLHRKVIGMCASLKGMEPAKRTSLVTDLMTGLNAMGYLDEGTLFNTPRKQAQEAAADEPTGRKSPMESKAPPPPQTDEVEEQVRTNVTRLNNIRELKEASTG